MWTFFHDIGEIKIRFIWPAYIFDLRRYIIFNELIQLLTFNRILVLKINKPMRKVVTLGSSNDLWFLLVYAVAIALNLVDIGADRGLIRVTD